jgi:hypothetical protein
MSTRILGVVGTVIPLTANITRRRIRDYIQDQFISSVLVDVDPTFIYITMDPLIGWWNCRIAHQLSIPYVCVWDNAQEWHLTQKDRHYINLAANTVVTTLDPEMNSWTYGDNDETKRFVEAAFQRIEVRNGYVLRHSTNAWLLAYREKAQIHRFNEKLVVDLGLQDRIQTCHRTILEPKFSKEIRAYDMGRRNRRYIKEQSAIITPQKITFVSKIKKPVYQHQKMEDDDIPF